MSNTAVSQAPAPSRQVQQSAPPPLSAAPAQSQRDQQSRHNTAVTAIPLVTSPVATQNGRTFTDLSGESTVAVDSIVNQNGLELSTIDPSSHHQLLGHMPLVATSSEHMSHIASVHDAHHAMTVGQPTHQNGSVISQLIHPNSYITGLSNGMSMPPHLSHANLHYQM